MTPTRASAAERRWVAWFAVALAAFTSLPYIVAAARGPHTFSGFLIGVEDGNSYIAKMLLGAAGDWLFRSPYSIAPQAGALLYLPYLLLGKLLGSGASHGWYVLAFHLFRLASLVTVCFATYAFLSFFVKKIALRRIGLALAALGGGLGWLVLLFGRSDWLGSMPLDFYSPESFGYLAVFGLPHLALARALLLFGLLQYLDERKTKPASNAILWLGLALTHLITAGLGLAIIGLHLLVLYFAKVDRSVGLRYAAWAGLGAAPVFLLNAYIFWQDGYLQAWAGQNQILSPHPLHYLLAYGLILPFALIALREWRNGARKLFCAVWLLSLPILLYVPLGLQRRFAEAAWVLLIALGLRFFDAAFAHRRRWLWMLAFALPSTLILWLGAMQAAWSGQSPVQRSADEAAVFSELRAQAEPGQVVLAAYSSSNALPAWAPLRVLAGHGPETVDFAHFEGQVAAFYEAETSDAERVRILQSNGVDFVLFGPQERAIGGIEPAGLDYLRPWFGVGAVQVYQVALPLE